MHALAHALLAFNLLRTAGCGFAGGVNVEINHTTHDSLQVETHIAPLWWNLTAVRYKRPPPGAPAPEPDWLFYFSTGEPQP